MFWWLSLSSSSPPEPVNPTLAPLERIGTLFDRAELDFEQTPKVFLRAFKFEKELEQVEIELKSAKTKESKATKTLEEVEQREQDLLKQFKKLVPANFVLSRAELLQKLTEEMQMRQKAGDVYKVYSERRGYLNQDDLDFIRPYQEYKEYPVVLEQKIQMHLRFIQILQRMCLM